MNIHNRKRNGRVTQAELDGDIFCGVELTPEEQKEFSKELAEWRKNNKMSEEVRIGLTLFSLRFRIEEYLESKEYDREKSFGNYLKQYVEKLELKRKELAAQLSINETLLSQLINGHRLPPDYIAIRLEIHSDNVIPALYWYKLVEKEKEHYIRTDQQIRKKEAKFVQQIHVVDEKYKKKPAQMALAGGKSRGILVSR